MKLVYESLMGGEGRWDTVSGLMEVKDSDLDEDDRSYVDAALDGIASHTSEIDDLIAAHAKGWTIDRLANVDLCILRLSVYELTRLNQSIPTSVSINEALELAHTYSTPESVKFINGVLGNISRAIKS